MMAVAAIAIGALLVPLIGGSWAPLAALRLHNEAWILGLFVLQAFIRGRTWTGAPAVDWAVLGWAVVCLALVAVLIPQVSRPGVAMVVLGLGLNLLVTLANEGMPYWVDSALTPAGVTEFYRLGTAGSQLLVLGDVLPGPARGNLYSVGDLLLFVGAVTFLLAASTCEHGRGARDSCDQSTSFARAPERVI